MAALEQKKRVICLYRVSTKGQVDHDDIPMQKQCCREFADTMDWEIIDEVSEKGVSGFKKSAKDRDAIVKIQEEAVAGKFDILLVYMFDRLGRKDDETPFIVEWFVQNGIEVWSTLEGQQRFDNHVDKLMNYIRYWQASGESIKTSQRTKTRSSQLVQEERYRGGPIPYGRRIEKQGRVNKKGHEVHEILVDEQEAAILRLIYQKYVYEGFGCQRLSKFLLNEGIRNRDGQNFTRVSLSRIIKNRTNIGLLKSGETEVFVERLRIIDQDTFDRAQEIMEARTQKHSDVPFNGKSRALLSGKVYCGHCGHKTTITTSSGSRYGGDGPRETRLRYSCHNKTMHPQDCNGQSGYAVSKLDKLVNKTIMLLFARLRAVPEQEMEQARHEQALQICEKQVSDALLSFNAKAKELESYKAEVYKAIQGTSSLDKDLLNELIQEAKEQLEGAARQLKQEQTALELEKNQSAEVQKQIGRLFQWTELYENATFDAQKMILAQLIDRVTVWKGYRIEIEFNVGYRQFFESLEADAQKSA